MKKSQKRIQSNNQEWGFFGTSQRNYAISEDVMCVIYDAVARSVMKTFSLNEKQAVEFLDSKSGRHFSDELSFHGANRWMSEKDFLDVVETTIEESHWVKLDSQLGVAKCATMSS